MNPRTDGGPYHTMGCANPLTYVGAESVDGETICGCGKCSNMLHLYRDAPAAEMIAAKLTQPVDVQSYFDRIRSAYSWPAYALPIASAPRDGTQFLAWTPQRDGFWFITAWSQHTQGSGFGIVDSCCGYYEDMEPTLWIPLPGAPK